MRGEALLFDPRSKALEEGLAARRAALLAAQNELRAVQRARDAAKQVCALGVHCSAKLDWVCALGVPALQARSSGSPIGRGIR
jgi:hypothetical protein